MMGVVHAARAAIKSDAIIDLDIVLYCLVGCLWEKARCSRCTKYGLLQ